MKSLTLPSFWKAYSKLTDDKKQSAKKSYQLWNENPFHPSLQFKCINRQEIFGQYGFQGGIVRLE